MSQEYDNLCRKYKINIYEAIEVYNYIRIFKENFFKDLTEVNNSITENSEWEYYPSIRSYNTHGHYSGIPGIQPKYFSIVCEELNIEGGNGRPLDSYKPY